MWNHGLVGDLGPYNGGSYGLMLRGWDDNGFFSGSPGDVAPRSAMLCDPGALERLRGWGNRTWPEGWVMGEIGISIIWIHDLRAHDIYIIIYNYIYIYIIIVIIMIIVIIIIYIYVRVATRTNTLLILLAQCQTALSTVRKGNPISKVGSAPQILRKHVNYPLVINHGLLENPTLTVDDTQFSYQKMRLNREVPSSPCLSRG